MPSPTSAELLELPVKHSTLIPVRETERINSVDVIRGVALLGILLMNIVGMGLPHPAYGDPSGAGGDTGWNLRAWLITNTFFEGTMRAMFSMLFGAGVLLFTGKDEEKAAGVSVADAWYRRTIWLSLFGVIHAYVLLWPGDILYSYGLMGMFLFPLRKVRPSRLFALGTGLLLIGAAAYLLENIKAIELHDKALAAQQVEKRGDKLTKEQEDDIKAWKDKADFYKPDEESKRDKVANIQVGYFSALKTKAEESYWAESEAHYRYDYFDILSMMLIGMALFKWRVFHAERSYALYGLMVLVGYGIGLPLNWYESITYMGQQFSVPAGFQVSLTYDLGRITTMTGHIGLIMIFCKSGILAWLRRRLAAVGRMALTNYLSHTLITTTVFVGFAQFGKWERHQLYFLVFGIWLFQLVISPIWLRHFYFGPMEWLWRYLTYLQKQPFRRIHNG